MSMLKVLNTSYELWLISKPLLRALYNLYLNSKTMINIYYVLLCNFIFKLLDIYDYHKNDRLLDDTFIR